MKLSKSDDKVQRSCPLKETETDYLQEVKRSNLVFHIWVWQKQTITVKIHNNNLENSKLLQKFWYNSVVFSSCKSKGGRLELWQKIVEARVWKRHCFLNSTHCEAIVSFNISNITQTEHTKVNISLLKAEVVTGKDSKTLW